MKDPYFAAILMRIESHIHETDRETLAAAGGFTPKDSAVKSALRKTELALGGKPPAKKPKGAEEEWIAALCGSLVAIGREMAKEGGLPPAHFIAALKATQESLVTRREMGGHPRGYLEFLEGFIGEARGEG
jgi:hypothetical protein